jgi:hypothetical protein
MAARFEDFGTWRQAGFDKSFTKTGFLFHFRGWADKGVMRGAAAEGTKHKGNSSTARATAKPADSTVGQLPCRV